MKIGVVSDSRFVIENAPNWGMHTFSISSDELSFYRLFHSAFATPARYVQEIFLRLTTLQSGNNGAKFIFNPLYDTDRLCIVLVLAKLREQAPFQDIVIFADQDGHPAGYLFPSWIKPEESQFLNLLSTVNAEIDAELCRRLFRSDAALVQVPYLSLGRVLHNGFLYEENQRIYRWVADRAINMLAPLGALPDTEAMAHRDTILMTAIMPHHAGDVLFFSIAWKRTQTHIGRLAVNQAYRDILSDNMPGLPLLILDVPVINRNGDLHLSQVTPEQDYFSTFCDNLPADSFYYYCRPSRDYNRTRFHLIDHYAFALGQRFYTFSELLSHTPSTTKLFTPDVPLNPPRVLLHFDGGWPLKVYPKEVQEILINMLHAKGYQVTILAGRSYLHPKCSVTTFQNLEQFKQLLMSHHILVGMDSFPSHYAVHVLGLPTICLFSSTRPENANAPSNLHYSALENGLPCRPCYGISHCQVYRTDTCKNFVAPERVTEEVKNLLAAYNPKECVPTDNYSKLQLGCHTPAREYEVTHPAIHINLNFIKFRAVLLGPISPYVRYIRFLYQEYVRAFDQEGVFLATFRVLRFFRKLFPTRS